MSGSRMYGTAQLRKAYPLCEDPAVVDVVVEHYGECTRVVGSHREVGWDVWVGEVGDYGLGPFGVGVEEAWEEGSGWCGSP